MSLLKVIPCCNWVILGKIKASYENFNIVVYVRILASVISQYKIMHCNRNANSLTRKARNCNIYPV